MLEVGSGPQVPNFLQFNILGPSSGSNKGLGSASFNGARNYIIVPHQVVIEIKVKDFQEIAS
jgi:hypothetical protein